MEHLPSIRHAVCFRFKLTARRRRAAGTLVGIARRRKPPGFRTIATADPRRCRGDDGHHPGDRRSAPRGLPVAGGARDRPAGAPFPRYVVIDRGRDLDMEAGVPVGIAVEGEIRKFRHFAERTIRDGHSSWTLPQARRRHGGPLGLGRAEGLTWDMIETENGQEWRCRLELYKTNPAKEPDASKWETELAFRPPPG